MNYKKEPLQSFYFALGIVFLTCLDIRYNIFLKHMLLKVRFIAFSSNIYTYIIKGFKIPTLSVKYKEDFFI